MRTQVGRYRLVRAIGRGGMGEVHLARYEALPGIARLAAVKLLRPDGATKRERLLDEARLMAHLSHPNVVQLLDVGIDDDVPWLALEFVPGRDLRRLTDAARARSIPLSPWVIARIVADACAGLHAVHEARDERGRPLGIVHRDVSPQNVLVTWDGVVKLADFGVARSAVQSARTTTGTVKGKLGYMAPEQLRGGAVDRRTDVFAMGVVLWEALAGRRLFAGNDEATTVARVLACEVPPLASVAPHAPAALSAIVGRALAREPSARFWTALELRQALEEAAARAGALVREPEVAETIAAVVPESVREHEAWLATDRIATAPLRVDDATTQTTTQAMPPPVTTTALLAYGPTGPPPPFVPPPAPTRAAPSGLAVAVVVAALLVLLAFGALVVLVVVRRP